MYLRTLNSSRSTSLRSAIILFVALNAQPDSSAQNVHPVIRYANTIGGSSADTATAMTTDVNGYVYITGQTLSTDFPGANRLTSPPPTPTSEIFVTKIAPSGGTVVFSTILGVGSPEAIAVDASGAIYVSGINPGANYPTTPGAYTAGGSCFLLKLAPTGSNLVYSSTLGCDYSTGIAGMFVDSLGDVYLTGSAWTIPTTPGSYIPTRNPTNVGAFALKINPQGSGLLYGTYLPVGPNALTVDPQGNAYFTGGASVKTFRPTINTFPTEDPSQFSPTDDVFLLKLSADGSKLVFSALFGGYGADGGSSIALGSDGSIYIAGASRKSTGFPPVTAFPTTAGVLDTVPGFPKGFLVRLPPTADSFIFSTLLTDLTDGQCLNVNAADGSADVFAGQRLLRVSSDGRTLESSMLVALTPGSVCGQNAGRFAIAAQFGTVSAPTDPTAEQSPNLSPLGPGGSGDIWFAAFDANVPGAVQLVLNTGELYLRSLPAADGIYPPAVQTFTAETVGVSVPIIAIGRAPTISASPESSTTPTNVTATVSGYSPLNSEVVVFAPGVQNALALLPASVTDASITPALNPPNVALNAPVGGAPVSSVIALSTTITTDVFGSQQSASVPFLFEIPGPAPAWLTLSRMSGTTPADIVVTANPTGLAAGLYGAELVVGSVRCLVTLQVGPAPPTPPQLVPAFVHVDLQLTPTIATASSSFHLDSARGPIIFKIDSPPSWLTLSEQTGVTPTDITVTATSPAGNAGTFISQMNISRTTDGSSIGLLSVVVNQTVPGYEGFFYVNPMPPISSYQPGEIPQVYAPGALFFISINPPLPNPQITVNANPGSLASTLAGYTFKIGNLVVPLRSYTNGLFTAQVPYEVAPGDYTIDAFDSTGTMIGSVALNAVGVAVPGFFAASLADPLIRATKQDGSTIDAANPVNVGDRILVRLSGQGSTVPPIPTGKAADPNNPSAPALPVTATIGGKPARVLSAHMSPIDAGVLDVWIQVPDLYAGDKNVRVRVASQTVGPLPIKVAGTAPAAAPDLVVYITYIGGVSQGQTGVNFTVNVSNSGSVPTTAPAAVLVQFPAGMTLTGLNGAGWTCVVQTATCARGDVLAAQDTFAPITATVNIDPNAPSPVTVSAVVSGGGETITWNDTGTVVVQINVVCPYQLSSGGQAFTAAGGTATLTITTRSSCTWDAVNSDSWVTLSAPFIGYGNGTLTYAVAANTGAARSTSIYIGGSGQYFKIDQAAAVIPGLKTIGSLAQVNSEGGWSFELDAVNLGNSAATARINFTGPGGNPLLMPLTFPQLATAAGPELAATLDRTINPNARIVIDSSGPASATALLGSGQLLSNGNVSGFGIFSYPASQWNAVVPLETRNASTYYLPFDNTGMLATGVALANITGTVASVKVTILNDMGAQIGTDTINLTTHAYEQFLLNAHYPQTAGLRGTIQFQSPGSGQISVLGVRANGTALTTLPVLSNVDSPGGSIPDLTYNGGFTSTFYLVNTGSSSASFTLSFFDQSGNPASVSLLLPQTGAAQTTTALTQTLFAGQMLEVATRAAPGTSTNVSGSAQLTTTGSISGFEIFDYSPNGQEASVPLETRTPSSFVLVYDNTNGLTTGVALANASVSAANIMANIYDDQGNLLQTATIELAGHAQETIILNKVYPNAANKRGMVQFIVPPSGPISMIGIRVGTIGATTTTTIPILTK